MKALSLTQPWASLVALGQKTVETRSWPTRYRGWLAIHAAKGLADLTVPAFEDLCHREPFYAALAPVYGTGGAIATDQLPRGQIVAVCRLVDCCRVDTIKPVSYPERAFGNYAPGRWAWQLAAIHILPMTVPARGMQGLWDWDAPPAVLALMEGR
jgi:hypothetical protein